MASNSAIAQQNPQKHGPADGDPLLFQDAEQLIESMQGDLGGWLDGIRRIKPPAAVDARRDGCLTTALAPLEKCMDEVQAVLRDSKQYVIILGAIADFTPHPRVQEIVGVARKAGKAPSAGKKTSKKFTFRRNCKKRISASNEIPKHPISWS